MGHFLALPPQLVLADGQFGCRNAENFATEPVKETFWVARRHSYLKILGDEAQYGFSHDVAYYVQPYLFLTLATNHIFLIHLKRVEYNASLTDRTVRKNMTESTWKLLLKCSFPNYCEVFKGCHLTHCWHSILNKYSEIDVEIFLVLVGLLTDYLPDYWLPFFILRRDFPLKSQTSSLVWGIEKWKWNRDAKKQKSFDLSVHVWALTIIHNVYYT